MIITVFKTRGGLPGAIMVFVGFLGATSQNSALISGRSETLLCLSEGKTIKGFDLDWTYSAFKQPHRKGKVRMNTALKSLLDAGFDAANVAQDVLKHDYISMVGAMTKLMSDTPSILANLPSLEAE